jgi:hypothetical protein
MDFLKSISIAASGLRAQAGRMRVISENLANADSPMATSESSKSARHFIENDAWQNILFISAWHFKRRDLMVMVGCCLKGFGDDLGHIFNRHRQTGFGVGVV